MASATDKSSTFVVIIAIVADAVIAVAKFGAGAFTGSSAMLAEGIHSTIDTANSALLLLGVHLSRKPADEAHPFGHGHEIYFWSLMVAIVIFGVGGGMSIYQGIGRLRGPEQLENPTWNYIVLGVAAVVGSWSFVVSSRAFLRQQRQGETLWRTFRRSKDPVIFTVFLEDAAAIVGLLLAFAGLLLAHLLRMPHLDAVASVAIGSMLTIVAAVLVYETRGLLVGESADPQEVKSIRALTEADPDVERVVRLMTMQLGPRQVLLTLDIKFHPQLAVPQLEAAIDRLEGTIRSRHPDVQQIFVEAESIKSAHGNGTGPKPVP